MTLKIAMNSWMWVSFPPALSIPLAKELFFYGQCNVEFSEPFFKDSSVDMILMMHTYIICPLDADVSNKLF